MNNSNPITGQADHDELVAPRNPSDSPDLDLLYSEYESAGGELQQRWNADRQDEVRFTRWPGQSTDGKKHRKDLDAEPKPWEGASDVRIPAADQVILDLKAALVTTVMRGKVSGLANRPEAEAAAEHAEATLNHFRRLNRCEWLEELDRFADYTLSSGVGALQIGWDTAMATIERTLRAVELPPEIQILLLDEANDEQLIAFARQQLPIEMDEAAQIIADLRETGEATYPYTYVRHNKPTLNARKYGYDIFWPSNTSNLDDARVVFIREFMHEGRLRENIVTDGWDEEWVKAAAKTRGHQDDDLNQGAEYLHEEGYENDSRIDVDSNDVEVVYAYYRQIDERGNPRLMCTVFCPHVDKDEQGALYAKHEAVGYWHGKIPAIATQQERMNRRLLDSRGIPEIAATWQDMIKAQCDMLVDRANLEINPAMTVPDRLGEKYRTGPGVKMKAFMGQGIEFMEPPRGNPGLAFNVVEMVERIIANYFGTPHPDVVPALWQLRLQYRAAFFMAAVEEAFSQMWQLSEQYLTPQERQFISGDVRPSAGPEMVASEVGFELAFDVRDLDMEYTTKKQMAIKEVVSQLDRAGLVDHAKLIGPLLNSIDPALARVVMSDQRGAAQRVREGVEKDVAMMALGNEVQYPKLDPAAGMKQQFVQDVVQKNPKYAMALGLVPGGEVDERFRELMMNYEKSLQQSVQQLGENKMAGLTGVKPVS